MSVMDKDGTHTGKPIGEPRLRALLGLRTTRFHGHCSNSAEHPRPCAWRTAIWTEPLEQVTITESLDAKIGGSPQRQTTGGICQTAAHGCLLRLLGPATWLSNAARWTYSRKILPGASAH